MIHKKETDSIYFTLTWFGTQWSCKFQNIRQVYTNFYISSWVILSYFGPELEKYLSTHKQRSFMEVSSILFLSAYGNPSQYQIGNHMKEILFCPYKNCLFALNFFFNITYTSLCMSYIKGFQTLSKQQL